MLFSVDSLGKTCIGWIRVNAETNLFWHALGVVILPSIVAPQEA